MNVSSPSPWTAAGLLVLIPSSPLPHPTLHHRVQPCKCASSSPMTPLLWQDPPTEGPGRTWGDEGKGEPRALLPLLLVLVESLAVAESLLWIQTEFCACSCLWVIQHWTRTCLLPLSLLCGSSLGGLTNSFRSLVFPSHV